MKTSSITGLLLSLLVLAACNRPDIGFLETANAAFSMDTLTITRYSNLRNHITGLQDLFRRYPEEIRTLMEATDALEADYAVKKNKQEEMYDECKQLVNKRNNVSSEADKAYWQALLDEAERKYYHWRDTVVWEVEKNIRDNKTLITGKASSLHLDDPYAVREEIGQLQKQMDRETPWTTAQIEQILGTQPLTYSLAAVKTDNGDAAARDFAGHLTIIGGGRMYVDFRVDSPEGNYTVSLKVENEGHSAILEDVFTFVLQ